MKNKYINPINIGLLSIILTLSTLLYLSINKANNNYNDITVSSIHQTETALVIHLQDNTSITISKLELEEKGFINLDDIVDWNTGKDEMAISLKMATNIMLQNLKISTHQNSKVMWLLMKFSQ